MYSLLTEQQQMEFIRIITSMSNLTTIANISSMTTTSPNAVNIEMDGSATLDQKWWIREIQLGTAETNEQLSTKK